MSAIAVLHVRPDDWSGPALGADFDVTVAGDSDAAVETLQESEPDCVVVEADLGAKRSIEVVAALRERAPSLPIVLCSAVADGTLAAEATRHDVTEYVPRDGAVGVGERVRAVANSRDPLGESFESIAGSIADAVVVIDPDSTIVFANDELATLSGHDRDALVGGSFERLIPPEYRDAHRAAVQQYVATGERTLDWDYVELSLLRADGEEVPVAVSFGEFERDGNRYFTGVIREISDRKDRQHALEATNDALEELATLAARNDLSRDERIREALSIGRSRLDLPIGYLTRTEGATQHVEVVEGSSELVTAGMSAPLSKTYCRQTIQGDGLLKITDAERDGWADHPAFASFGVSCYLGGTIVVDGETYGTLCFAARDARDRDFTDAEGRLVRLLVEWVGNEIEREQRETELQRYADIIEAVDDGVYALNETGHFQLVNDAMLDLTGYDAAELLGAHTSHVKSDAVVDRAETIVRSMIFGEREDDEATFDLEIQRADGSTFPAEDHMTMLWDDDGETFEGTAGIVRDITNRKERELELRDANRRIEQILKRIGDAFFAVDDEWTLTYWNSRAEEVLGRPAEEVMGENLWEMFPEAVDSLFDDAYHEAMETQQPVVFEEYYPPIEKWFRVTAYPDTEGLSVYFHDITDQKERDQRLSGLLETTRSLMQAHTAEAVAETVVEAAQTTLDFDLNLVRLHDGETGTLEPIAGTNEMPDRPVYETDEAFPGEAFQRGETIRVDDFDRIENYDSERAEAAMYVPIGDHGVLSVATRAPEAFDDADVSVAEILASNAAAALDRVEREQDLLRYETVVENVRDMVYVLDADGRFQLVTEPLADWLGYDRAELVGSRPELVLEDESVAAFTERIRDLQGLDESATIQMETTLRTAQGEDRPVEIEVSLLDDDVFRGNVGVVRDLTELKAAREELRDERDRFSYLFNNLPDAVVETEFTDDGAMVRSVNPAFTDVFGLDHSEVLDRELDDTLLPPSADAKRRADKLATRGAAGEPVQSEIRRRTENGFRDFLFRGIPYCRDDDRVWSFGIYTDITEQKERERRLEVLNRVLRHNLRNDLTVVMGLADELDDRIDDEMLHSLLERLQRKAAQIASLSDRARDIERSVRRDDAGTDPIDIPEAVRSLVATYEQQHGVHIETSLPETPVTGADGRFRRAVGELLDNSLEHAGEDPAVSVTVETTADTISVTVADDGPGIPDHELSVVTGDEPITQLSHGSGLGLWLVTWVTESYGGTVEFADDGAAVTLSLPRGAT